MEILLWQELLRFYWYRVLYLDYKKCYSYWNISNISNISSISNISISTPIETLSSILCDILWETPASHMIRWRRVIDAWQAILPYRVRIPFRTKFWKCRWNHYIHIDANNVTNFISVRILNMLCSFLLNYMYLRTLKWLYLLLWKHQPITGV